MADQINSETFAIGDQVMINHQNVLAEIIDVRQFDGRTTYVVHTKTGKRMVVGLRQLTRVSE